MDYRGAGVNIEAGNAFVAQIRSMAATTHRPEVIGSLGGFGGLCRVPAGLNQPLLVAGADGVGTKLALAQDWGYHRQVGIDLVAMSVNDVITSGADPLFFLDYIASGHLICDQLAAVVDGMAWACRISGCTLLGGETAEMPDFYEGGRYDLAGFCVGVVNAPNLIDGRHIQPGDQVIAVASSGPHSNGFSLIRKVLNHSGVDPHAIHLGTGTNMSLAQQLMEPTRLYAPLVRQLCQRAIPIHGMVHITGGGLPGNLPRCLPEDANLHLALDAGSWSIPSLFHWLQQQGKIPEADLWSTFNLGIGFCLVVPSNRVDEALACCQDCGEQSWRLGQVLAGQGSLKGLPF